MRSFWTFILLFVLGAVAVDQYRYDGFYIQAAKRMGNQAALHFR